MTKKDEQTFTIFDGDEESYRLKSTSNTNIRRVFAVICAAQGVDMDKKKYYAMHGGLRPAETKKNEQGETVNVYSFEQLYTRATMWAALAEELFYGVEPLGEIRDSEYVVTDSERFDELIRGEVRRAFASFVGECGIKPWEDVASSGTHGMPLNFTSLLKQLAERSMQNESEHTENTNEP